MTDEQRINWLESAGLVEIGRFKHMSNLNGPAMFEVTPYDDNSYEGATLREAIDKAMGETPLAFNLWDLIDRRWRFIAKDSQGTIYLFRNRPEKGTTVGRWLPTGDDYQDTVLSPCVWDTGDRDWTETLVERPNK